MPPPWSEETGASPRRKAAACSSRAVSRVKETPSGGRAAVEQGVLTAVSGTLLPKTGTAVSGEAPLPGQGNPVWRQGLGDGPGLQGHAVLLKEGG